jgi:alkanesulfonate monooxygenase SsuD/methylene tetrahydromethanopterin reductase-like flavin-dependent oxidoreductase (luciferase family)
MPAREIEFGWVATAAGAPGMPDRKLFEDLVDDASLFHSLGFTTAWMLEHHFSDYFPTPDPMQMLTYLASRFPGLNLGTCVIVTPWHNPLRLAEQIATLSVLTPGHLHLGLGRGTAKFEYDAFDMNMEEARDRFREIWEILRLSLSGDRFTYRGAHYDVPTEIRLRPTPVTERISFYGAIGSPESAGIMAELGMPPICTSIGDMERQRETLSNWREAAEQAGTPVDGVTLPLMINCIIADTDEEAVREAQEFMPRFMKAQVDHYTVHATDWANTKGYEAWQRQWDGIVSRQDPANIPSWTRWQLVGSADTVASRLDQFIDAGFNHFILHVATPGVPVEDRRRWATRFAREVGPRFSSSFSGRGGEMAAAV